MPIWEGRDEESGSNAVVGAVMVAFATVAVATVPVVVADGTDFDSDPLERVVADLARTSKASNG